jgi:hypothetical protein
MAVRADGAQDLEQLSQRELVRMARKRGIRGAYRMRKAELVEALRRAEAREYADNLKVDVPLEDGAEPRAQRRQEDRRRARRRSVLFLAGAVAAVVLIVVVLVLALSGGGGSDVGATKSAGATTYKLLAVTTQPAIGTLTARNGTFVVADIEVTPPSGVRAFASGPPTTLAGGDGVTYEPPAQAAEALGPGSLANQELKAGATVSGKVGFDVPTSAVTGSKLVLRDLAGSDTATFRTGL